MKNTSFLFPHLVETGSQEPGDLLDQSVRGEEGVIGGGQLLHLLLVLVELLEVVSAHGVHTQGLGLVNMGLISQQTHLVLPPGHVLQPAMKTTFIASSITFYSILSSGGKRELFHTTLNAYRGGE